MIPFEMGRWFVNLTHLQSVLIAIWHWCVSLQLLPYSEKSLLHVLEIYFTCSCASIHPYWLPLFPCSLPALQCQNVSEFGEYFYLTWIRNILICLASEITDNLLVPVGVISV